jgi:hypothetical protein
MAKKAAVMGSEGRVAVMNLTPGLIGVDECRIAPAGVVINE